MFLPKIHAGMRLPRCRLSLDRFDTAPLSFQFQQRPAPIDGSFDSIGNLAFNLDRKLRPHPAPLRVGVERYRSVAWQSGRNTASLCLQRAIPRRRRRKIRVDRSPFRHRLHSRTCELFNSDPSSFRLDSHLPFAAPGLNPPALSFAIDFPSNPLKFKSATFCLNMHLALNVGHPDAPAPGLQLHFKSPRHRNLIPNV